MQIKSLLTPARTLCRVNCTSKKRILETLASLIAEGSDNINATELFEQLIARERLGSTGLGGGIAIPHCRFNTSGSTLGALMTLANPIDFDAVDNRPVDIIFAMLVPEDSNTEHLQTLAHLAEQLQNKHYISALRQAETNETLYHKAIQLNA